MCWCAHHFILLQSRLYKQFFSFLDFTAIVIAVKRNICCSGAEGDAKKLLKMIAEHAQHSNSEDDTQNEGKEDDDEGMDIQGTFNFDPQGNGIVSVGASAMVSLKKAQAKMGMIEEHLKQISSLHAS
eukprot:m.185144 g.185144  ORF g.185144 m.185144 type:complete len:127 (+) comp13603_c0_seq10:1016-1396(+)